MSPFLAWGDFHARSRFARSTIPEEKWGTTRSLNEHRPVLIVQSWHVDLVAIMAEKVRFGAVDFTVFAVMLLLSAIIGIYHAFTGGRQRTTKEFLFANRGMMGIPVALSLLASFMSAITILGVPSEIYIYGTQYWLIIASYVILFPAVALVFVPVFRAVEISSSYEVGSRCSSCAE